MVRGEQERIAPDEALAELPMTADPGKRGGMPDRGAIMAFAGSPGGTAA